MKRALCIGISNYAGSGNDLPDAHLDAQAWADRLFSLGFEPTLLIDANATKRGVLHALEEVARGMGRCDHLAVTYSGHGTNDPDPTGTEPDGMREAVVCADLQLLFDDEIDALIRQSPIGRKTMVFDSCNSGTVTRAMMNRASLFGSQRKPRFMPFSDSVRRPKLVSRIFRSRLGDGRVVLSGCQDSEYSYSTGKGGALTLAALHTLRPGLSAVEWHREILRILPTSEFPQRPNLDGLPSDLARTVFS